MTQKTGSPPLYLVASMPETRNPQRARDAVLLLEQCRIMLLEGEHTETVQLLDIVLLQLRMQLRGISDAELKDLCDVLADRAGNASHHDV